MNASYFVPLKSRRAQVLALCIASAFETWLSRAQAVRLEPKPSGTALLSSTITVTASPATVSFTLTPAGIAYGAQSVSISTSWLLGVAATVRLYAIFPSTAALTNTNSASSMISNAQVAGLCTTGQVSSYTPFTQGGPFGAGTSLQLFQQTALLSLLSSRTDQLNLRIDLSGTPQLPPGQYVGTLILQAQAL